MVSFRHLSIKHKLVWGTMLASTTALVLAAGAFLTYELVQMRSSVVRDLSAQAGMIGLNSISAILFQDQRTAGEVLSSLSAEPDITSAAIYTSDGAVFATYSRPNSTGGSERPERLSSLGNTEAFREDRLILQRTIVHEGKPLGAVLVHLSLQEMMRRTRQYVMIVLAVLLLSSAVAYYVSTRMRRVIAGPIALLADTARSVSTERNYAIRAPAGHSDEIGVLIETFNEMLEQIERRDAELQEAGELLEARVQARTAELVAANKELEGFTYSVSHDLRAPLRHVDGFARILEEEHAEELRPEARQHLERIRQGAQRMGALIDDLLNLSRVTRKPLQLQVTGLDTLVREVLEELKPEAQGREVEWRIGQLPFVECDPALLKQVFVNLLSNALKFTRPQERAIIEVGQTVENGHPVVFVRDNGVGFSMKYADKLFGVFQRLHRAEDFEGTGVGLATVQRILGKHGASVRAEGKLNEGATFYFTLGSAAARNMDAS